MKRKPNTDTFPFHTKVFQGNSNPTEVVYRPFAKPVLTRFVRIRPVTWENGVSLRFEVYGCKITGKAFKSKGIYCADAVGFVFMSRSNLNIFHYGLNIESL